jgi:DNA-binding response OmpR family regulator
MFRLPFTSALITIPFTDLYNPLQTLLPLKLTVSGYEVTCKIRETWQANELPIVLLTARNQVSDLVVGLEAGANDYLTKPIAKDELLARIKTHCTQAAIFLENARLYLELQASETRERERAMQLAQSLQ